MDGGIYRVEAERWLTIAEKLLSARDFQGAKTFAIRARDSDPRLVEFADQIIAVADTVVAGDSRVVSFSGGGSFDYYAILQLPRLSQSLELIASQYRRLSLLLNPARNGLSFADHAFRLISEAWLVFSDPAKKALYDSELQMSQLGQFGQFAHFGQMAMARPEFSQSQMAAPFRPIAQHVATEPIRPVAQTRPADPIWPQPQATPTEPVRPTSQHQPKPTESVRSTAQPKPTESVRSTAQPNVVAEPSRPSPSQSSQPATQRLESTRSTPQATQPVAAEPQVPSFWTACPYCYILYEYPKCYEDCALRCQKCRRAFHASSILPPPVNDKDTYFCSWGYFPLGFSGRGKGGGGFSAKSISAIFGNPKQKKTFPQKNPSAKVIYDDDVFINLSDTSDDEESDSDWDGREDKRKKVKNSKGKSTPSNNVKRYISQIERSKKAISQNGASGGNVPGKVVGKGEGTSGKKRGAKDLGKLDLNVMFSNEAEEAAPGASESNGAGNGEEDNIEGIGFFEGLDEFFSSLPILSAVGDDKVRAS